MKFKSMVSLICILTILTVSNNMLINVQAFTYLNAVGQTNELPVLVNSIADVIGIENGNSIMVDLSNAFLDPDGNVITFTAQSSDINIAKVDVIGRTIALAPLKHGSTIITILADDGLGGIASTNFKFTVQRQASAFGNAVLIDVAYSETLKLFVAVGNIGTKGVIYTSTDGLDWTTSKSNAAQLGSYSNGNATVVWLPSEMIFVVYQTSEKIYTSADGYTWLQPNQQGYGSGIATDGNTLFSYSNNTVTKYIDLNNKVDALVQTSGNAWLRGLYCSIGNSNTAYLAVGGYYGWYSLDSGTNWISKSPLAGGYGTVVGAVYSNNMNQFVEICSEQGWFMNLMDIYGNISCGQMQGTNVSNANRASSIATSGSRFMLGMNDGSIYTAIDDASFTGNTVWSEISKASNSSSSNSIPMKKICYGNGKFVAVGNNGTSSDAIIINDNSSNYISANDVFAEKSLIVNSIEIVDQNSNPINILIGGQSVTVNASVNNVSTATIQASLILGIYNNKNELVKLSIYPDIHITPNINDNLISNTFVIPEDIGNCTAKAYIWDGFGSLKPYSIKAIFPQALYVATNGSDLNSGTISSPFKTLEKARDAIRDMKINQKIPFGRITVYLRGGSYKISNTFNLSEADSGSIDAPITYMAYQNESVSLTGGETIQKEWFMPVTDPVILDRIIDTQAKSKLMKVNFGENGITDYGIISRRGSQVSENKIAQMELSINGENMTLARWPNQGSAPIESYIDNGTLDNGGTFKYIGTRPELWTQAKDIWIGGSLQANYSYNYYPVESIDTISKQIKLKQGAISAYYSPPWYYAENLLEEIDVPGEYYIDRDSGSLYLLPPESFSGTNVDIKVSMAKEPLINIDNASYINFQNITMQMGRSDAMNINDGAGITIKNCEIKSFGGNGISIVGSNHLIKNCYVHHIGKNGIILNGGDSNNLERGNNAVENCKIEDFAYLEKSYNVGVLLIGVGNRISNNLIQNGPHAGIILYGNDHLINNNEITNVVKEFDDMDAIYINNMLEPWQRGNVIKENYFHDIGTQMVGSWDGQPYQFGVSAIRTDNAGHGLNIQRNIFNRIGQTGSNQVRAITAQGNRNSVINNMFIDCNETYFAQMQYTPSASFDISNSEYIGIQQKLDSLQNTVYQQEYPELFDFFNEYPQAVATNLFQRNLVVNTQVQLSSQVVAHDSQGFKGATELMIASNNWVTQSNPGFTDYANNKFDLKLDSAVFSNISEFKTIDFDKIGLIEPVGIN